jgi:ATP-dependent DNA ligase
MSLRERTRPGPSGTGWLHEIKRDGFRILARRDAAGVRLITRAGNDLSVSLYRLFVSEWLIPVLD